MATGASAVALLLGLQILCVLVAGEDPYRFFTWNVTYGNIYPLGVKQQVSSCILYSALLFFSTLKKQQLLWNRELCVITFISGVEWNCYSISER
jgi:hypothetical protein